MRVTGCAALLLLVAWTPSVRAQVTTTYQYDDLGRLKNASYSSKNITYNYDPAGNRTTVATQTNTPHFQAGAVSAAKAKRHRKKH